jgi:hypothetical protein
MQMVKPLIAFTIIAAMATCGGSVYAQPANKTSSSNPVQLAAAALLKEYQTVMKDKKGEGLREKCDYFTTNKVEGLTPELILAALEKPISPDPRADAYVKWQLLSGAPSKWPDALKARALKVYRAAPVPKSHPGLDHSGFDRALNRNIGVMNKDAEMPVNKEVAEKIRQYRDAIEPILSYRDELYARLPVAYDTLVAGLSDVYTRASAGAPANEFFATVAAASRSWALTSNEAANMRQLAGAIDKLRTFVKDEKNKPYYRVIWAKEDNYTGLKWLSEATIQNDKAMEEAATWLMEHAQNPGGGGLKFKNP